MLAAAVRLVVTAFGRRVALIVALACLHCRALGRLNLLLRGPSDTGLQSGTGTTFAYYPGGFAVALSSCECGARRGAALPHTVLQVLLARSVPRALRLALVTTRQRQ